MTEQTGFRVCRCGKKVVRGMTDIGTYVDVEQQVEMYLIDWTAGTPEPRLMQSRGYPVHRCVFEEDRRENIV